MHGVQHVCQVQIKETSSGCVMEEIVLVAYFYCVTAFIFESTQAVRHCAAGHVAKLVF